MCVCLCALDDEDSDSMDEEDVDDELGLPKELMNSVSLKEKRELLQYKQTHNEVTCPFPCPAPALQSLLSTFYFLRCYSKYESYNISCTVSGRTLMCHL